MTRTLAVKSVPNTLSLLNFMNYDQTFINTTTLLNININVITILSLYISLT